MIILDHNIPENQVEQLRLWKIHFKQVGFEVGRPEWDDQQEILRYLHATRKVTFFTRDLGFFRRRLCHPNYCIVVLIVPVKETASYIRRLLRHPRFKTRAGRVGKVLKLSSRKILLWQGKSRSFIGLTWSA